MLSGLPVSERFHRGCSYVHTSSFHGNVTFFLRTPLSSRAVVVLQEVRADPLGHRHRYQGHHQGEGVGSAAGSRVAAAAEEEAGGCGLGAEEEVCGAQKQER